jgi:hypothetical protein
MLSEHTPLLAGPKDVISTDTNLSKFRRAVGINMDAKHDDLEAARKTAQGLYKEIITVQRWRHRQYLFIDVVFYVALGTQIVIGACLAALGPLSSTHSTAITTLGVVNSSLAGVLALLKGQNLPDRLRKDGFEMSKVQDYIEETEIRLEAMEGGEEFTENELDKVLQTVFAKYNAARDTAEMNRPDTYAHQGVQDVEDRARTETGRNMITGNTNGKKKDTDIHYEIS